MNKDNLAFSLIIIGIAILAVTAFIALFGISATYDGFANWRNEAQLNNDVNSVKLVMSIAPSTFLIGGVILGCGAGLLIRSSTRSRQ